MTAEESAFQAALDKNPADQTTRLVFADWLEERGDPRAPGYRALAALARVPVGSSRWRFPGFCKHTLVRVYATADARRRELEAAALPPNWFDLCKIERAFRCGRFWMVRATRREAEDHAALAFNKLHPFSQRRYAAGRSSIITGGL